MRVCYFDSAAQVGQAAAVLINAQLLKKPESVLGLATGSTAHKDSRLLPPDIQFRYTLA